MRIFFLQQKFLRLSGTTFGSRGVSLFNGNRFRPPLGFRNLQNKHNFNQTMKRTLFLTMTAAVLLGGQAFAASTVHTVVENGVDIGGAYADPNAVSEYNNVSGGVLTVYEVPGSGSKVFSVSAGVTFAVGKSANSNKTTMHSGMVDTLQGGTSFDGPACENTVIMTGGKTNVLVSGQASSDGDSSGDANGNVVIMTGGKLEYATKDLQGDLFAGYAGKGAARNNQVHLVGTGAEDIILFAADGTWDTYTGSSISIDGVICSGYSEKGITSNNSVDIYGTDISAKTLTGLNSLNFHLVDELVSGDTAMLNLSETVTLSGVSLSFDVLESMSWKEGTIITLMQDSQTISGVTPQHVNIYEHGSTTEVAAEGDLKVVGNNLQLSITKVNGAVPEPTTTTLSLLALAGLAARRRRH